MGTASEERYSVTECWAARGLASSGDDAAPTQGDAAPLTSFSSNPASSVVVAPATNAPATRTAFAGARPARFDPLQPLQQSVDDPLPPPRRERRRLRVLRQIDHLLTLSQPSSCSRLSPVSTFVLLSLDDATPNVLLAFLWRENLVPTSALRAESLSAARYTTLTITLSMLGYCAGQFLRCGFVHGLVHMTQSAA